MSTDQANAPQPNRSLYAIILVGVVIVGGFAVWSLQDGGLPGTTNSPSATVNGQPTVGKTGGG